MDGILIESRSAAVPAVFRSHMHSRRGAAVAQRVLVPIGRSNGYRHALAHAVQRRGSDLGEIVLLNVRPILKVGVVSRSTNAQRVAEAQRAYGEDLMRPAMVWLDDRRIQYSAEVEFGPAVETMLRYARRKACTAIVIGIEGGDSSSFSPGSVACKALRLSELPLTIVNGEGIEISTCRARAGEDPQLSQ